MIKNADSFSQPSLIIFKGADIFGHDCIYIYIYIYNKQLNFFQNFE